MVNNFKIMEMERLFHSQMECWRRYGLIRDWTIESDFLEGDIRLTLEIPHFRPLVCVFSRHEIAMDGIAALSSWLDTIERELTILSRERGEHGQSMGVPTPRPQERIQEVNQAYRVLMELMESSMFAVRPGPGWFGDYYLAQPGFTQEAEEKSKKLFIATAGKKAFDILNSGKTLPITGSEGTDYRLFRRATYCVERPRDGARLCAVVPDVPLWDHLLGIKLMVEHDEPTFLRTANVSGGRGGLGRSP